MAQRNIVSQLPPYAEPLLNQDGIVSLAWRRFFESQWLRTGGFNDSIFALSLLGLTGDATLAELASNTEANSQLIESLRAISEAGRVIELESEIAAIRQQVDALKGQVDSSFGQEADAIIQATTAQAQAVSSANLNDEVRQEISELRAQIDRANQDIASIRGDTSGYEDLINGNVIVGKAATLDPGRNINTVAFNGSVDITVTANWNAARTLSFTGDVTGSNTVDGSGDVAFALTIGAGRVTPTMLTTGGPSWDASGNLTAVTYKVGSDQVVSSRKTGWAAATGTHNRGAYASYAGQTVSAGYVQIEVQAIDDALKALSRRFYSLETDITSHGLIGA